MSRTTQEIIQSVNEIAASPNPLTHWGAIIELHNEAGLTPFAKLHRGCACKLRPEISDPLTVYTRLINWVQNQTNQNI